MKKLLVLCLAVLMMASMAIPAFAVISPEADVITTTTGGVPDQNTNDSATSPQTGSALVLLAAGAAVAGIVGAGATAKKLSDKD